MKILSIWLSFACTIFTVNPCVAQFANKAVEIRLPEQMMDACAEYSGMCLYEGKIFLLPQSDIKKDGDRPFLGKIYSISLNAKSLVLGNIWNVPSSDINTYTIINFTEISRSIKDFSGFEAMAILNNTIFLIVETDGAFDYIVKGYFTGSSIELSTEKLRLPKILKHEKIIPNAGYESLAIWNHKLLTAFEWNFYDHPKLYEVDTSLHDNISPIEFEKLPLRLTDITPYKENVFLGINHYWHGEKKYYGLSESENKYPFLKNLKWNEECFSRIIKITLDKKAKKMMICDRWMPLNNSHECNNWEGIVPFASGVILVSDANCNPDRQKTKLIYYPFNE
jgi:hypothetical protein